MGDARPPSIAYLHGMQYLSRRETPARHGVARPGGAKRGPEGLRGAGGSIRCWHAGPSGSLRGRGRGGWRAIARGQMHRPTDCVNQSHGHRGPRIAQGPRPQSGNRRLIDAQPVCDLFLGEALVLQLLDQRPVVNGIVHNGK